MYVCMIYPVAASICMCAFVCAFVVRVLYMFSVWMCLSMCVFAPPLFACVFLCGFMRHCFGLCMYDYHIAVAI